MIRRVQKGGGVSGRERPELNRPLRVPLHCDPPPGCSIKERSKRENDRKRETMTERQAASE